MNNFRFRILALSFMTFLFFNGHVVFSQSYQSSPTDLVLEVTYLKGRPPAYQTVPGQGAKLNGSWYANFGHIAPWQPPAGFLPVQAVNILSHQEGDGVRVVVSVFVGEKNFEKEVAVGTYLIHQNEMTRTDEITKFGVEPFEIKASKTFPVQGNLPQIINKTSSIVVTNVELNESTLPSYKLMVHNLSGKNVLALGIDLFVNNRRRIGSLRQGEDSQALIAANSEHELKIPGANNAHPTTVGYAPEAPLNQEIHINTVVFDDGSYEGDAETAVKFRGFMVGRKIQVGKVVPLIKAALNELEQNPSQALENFKTRLAALTVEAPAGEIESAQQQFQSLDERARAFLKTAIEVALNGVKFDLARDLQGFEKASAQRPDVNALKLWLSRTLERYEKWAARL